MNEEIIIQACGNLETIAGIMQSFNPDNDPEYNYKQVPDMVRRLAGIIMQQVQQIYSQF